MSWTTSLCAALLAAALPPAASALEWVTIGDAGNPPDDQVSCRLKVQCVTDLGSVPYRFQLSRFETTNAEYAAFLNAVGASDPRGLFNTNMQAVGEIVRSGSGPNCSTGLTTRRSRFFRKPASTMATGRGMNCP